MKKLTTTIKYSRPVLFLVVLTAAISSCKKNDTTITNSQVTDPEIKPLITTASAIALRSEYEKVGDIIYDANLSSEGSGQYSIIAGNTDNYYAIGAQDGVLKILNTIPDVMSTLRTDLLTIKCGTQKLALTIVDGYDYTIQNLPAGYSVLDDHNEKYIDPNTEWTVLNNLWGKGTAIPNADFRIATLFKTGMPDSTIFIWDVPGPASGYGGASVWCYVNTFFGNRKGTREDLARFPFKVSALNTLNLDFNFQQLYGNEEYKIAMNMFMTNESYLTNFSSNDGDFFFVFDQKGNYIPPYPFSLPDTVIGGKNFARRYEVDNTTGYEWRRVIIKNGEKYLSGSLDLKKVFGGFSNAGYLNPQQYIYHIQLGLEITDGYGAVRFNKAQITMGL